MIYAHRLVERNPHPRKKGPGRRPPQTLNQFVGMNFAYAARKQRPWTIERLLAVIAEFNDRRRSDKRSAIAVERGLGRDKRGGIVTKAARSYGYRYANAGRRT